MEGLPAKKSRSEVLAPTKRAATGLHDSWHICLRAKAMEPERPGRRGVWQRSRSYGFDVPGIGGDKGNRVRIRPRKQKKEAPPPPAPPPPPPGLDELHMHVSASPRSPMGSLRSEGSARNHSPEWHTNTDSGLPNLSLPPIRGRQEKQPPGGCSHAMGSTSSAQAYPQQRRSKSPYASAPTVVPSSLLPKLTLMPPAARAPWSPTPRHKDARGIAAWSPRASPPLLGVLGNAPSPPGDRPTPHGGTSTKRVGARSPVQSRLAEAKRLTFDHLGYARITSPAKLHVHESSKRQRPPKPGQGPGALPPAFDLAGPGGRKGRPRAPRDHHTSSSFVGGPPLSSWAGPRVLTGGGRWPGRSIHSIGSSRPELSGEGGARLDGPVARGANAGGVPAPPNGVGGWGASDAPPASPGLQPREAATATQPLGPPGMPPLEALLAEVLESGVGSLQQQADSTLMLLRADWKAEGAVDAVQARTHASLHFISRLAARASELSVLQGTLLQALMAHHNAALQRKRDEEEARIAAIEAAERAGAAGEVPTEAADGAAGAAGGFAGRDEQVDTMAPVLQQLEAAEMGELEAGGAELRGLLRIKVEDDADLVTARRALAESGYFLLGLRREAAARAISEHELLRKLELGEG